MPIRKHITRFQAKAGIAPQIAVETNKMVDRRMETRRPWTSASQPHMNDPTVVPVSAISGSSAASDLAIAYSAESPGSTKPSVAGFITSMTRPSVSTSRVAACQRPSGVLSGAS